jgi:spore coat polysaccharide biosynthesis predicted glycosyltransferase SpsG
MTARRRRFLLVPAAGAGDGVGHLTRCLRLAAGLDGDVGILTRSMDVGARAFLLHELAAWESSSRPTVVRSTSSERRWDMVIVDQRQTSLGELAELSGLGPPVSFSMRVGRGEAPRTSRR